MIFSLALLILSCVYLVLIVSFYFSKKRINNLENKLYSFLLFCDLGCIILELGCFFTAKYIWPPTTLSLMVGRFYLIAVVTWILLFTIYVFFITTNEDKKKILLNNKKKFTLVVLLIEAVFILLMAVLPMEYFTDGSVAYSYGLSVNVLIAIAVVSVLFDILKIVLNYKRLERKKIIPVLFLAGLLVLIAIVKSAYPYVQLVSCSFTIIVIIMYFTIENPDMKLIEQLNVEKDRADKANSAKTDFLSSMSHEIRTPLNAIVGFSNSLLDKDLSPEAKDEVDDIIMASESLVDLVNGILDISKIEANKLEIINVEYNFKSLFDDLVSLTKARLGEKPLEIRTTCDGMIPDVLFGDSVRLKQIILNLLTNSVKYTKEGFIDFKVGSMISNDNCRLVISVEDSGIGIKKENIDKLFTKFERLGVEKNDTIEGTGLGLAITKNLVELMNGKIYVQSEYSKGSRFTVIVDQKIVFGKTINDLPRLRAKEEAKDINIDNKKILIVDDNKLNLKVASRLLQKYGNPVITECESGLQCLDIIKNGATFDLILMDDMMPKMGGVETFKNLKNIPGFNIPTIALTANAISGMREKYISDGFDDYLSKPIELNELSRVLKKYLTNN